MITMRTAGRPRMRARRTKGIVGAAVLVMAALIAMATVEWLVRGFVLWGLRGGLTQVDGEADCGREDECPD